MLLAVMTLAALGHTGRQQRADDPAQAVYVLVLAATVLRMVAAWHTGFGYPSLLGTSLCWTAALLLFVARYGPMLLAPRRS